MELSWSCLTLLSHLGLGVLFWATWDVTLSLVSWLGSRVWLDPKAVPGLGRCISTEPGLHGLLET